MPVKDPRGLEYANPVGYWSQHNITNNTGTVTLTGTAPGAGTGLKLLLTSITVELTGAATEVQVWMGGSQRMSYLVAAGTATRLLVTGEPIITAAGETDAIAIIVTADGTRTRTMVTCAGKIVPA